MHNLAEKTVNYKKTGQSMYVYTPHLSDSPGFIGLYKLHGLDERTALFDQKVMIALQKSAHVQEALYDWQAEQDSSKLVYIANKIVNSACQSLRLNLGICVLPGRGMNYDENWRQYGRYISFERNVLKFEGDLFVQFPNSKILLNPRILTPDNKSVALRYLAHEFAHHLQFVAMTLKRIPYNIHALKKDPSVEYSQRWEERHAELFSTLFCQRVVPQYSPPVTRHYTP